jgi:hypothetical protein
MPSWVRIRSKELGEGGEDIEEHPAPGEPIELRHPERVAGPDRRERL